MDHEKYERHEQLKIVYSDFAFFVPSMLNNGKPTSDRGRCTTMAR